MSSGWTLGFSVRAVLFAYASLSKRCIIVKAVKARFTKPSIPGQPLEIQMWQNGNCNHFKTIIVDSGASEFLKPLTVSDGQVSYRRLNDLPDPLGMAQSLGSTLSVSGAGLGGGYPPRVRKPTHRHHPNFKYDEKVFLPTNEMMVYVAGSVLASNWATNQTTVRMVAYKNGTADVDERTYASHRLDICTWPRFECTFPLRNDDQIGCSFKSENLEIMATHINFRHRQYIVERN